MDKNEQRVQDFIDFAKGKNNKNSGIIFDHDLIWSLEQVMEKSLALIPHQSKFQMGQRVRLAVTPVITNTESFGWLSSKHFLAKGALATIAAIDFYKDHFCYNLMFDNESWEETKWGTKEVIIHPTPPEKRHMFCFREADIEAAPDKCPTCGKPPCGCHHHCCRG
jgi:hypothetical protein